jgi:hypothetical protein
MRIRKIAAAAALGLASVGLSACATGLNTQVSRYQAAAIVPGQTFYVVPEQGAASPEFYRYAAMVSQQLAAQGLRPAGAPQVADLLVRLDYGVDEGATEYVSEPYLGSPYRYGGFGYYRRPYIGPWYGSGPYYSRWGGAPFYYGWDDPFLYGSSYSGRVREYTVYKSFLDMDIVRRADNAPLFEGHAKARSRDDELNRLVPSLVTAMFTGFPGRSGETVKITVPPAKS